MFNSNRDMLLKELNKPESSDGSAFGVLGIGTLIIGGIAAPSATLIVGTVLGIAGPIMAVVGFGGAGIIITRKFLKKQGEKGV
ncbi:hypothetical protein D3C76_01210 [compost metagenome]